MARSANLFRFVAVRPPAPRIAEEPPRLENPAADEAFVGKVKHYLDERGGPLARARRAVAEAVLVSESYFVRDEAWQPLRPSRSRFVAVLEGAASGAGREAARKAAQGLIKELFNGKTLARWLRSDTYAELKASLWRSYYANVLASELRPHDRSEIVAWARVFRLLEGLAGNGEMDLTQLAAALLRARPHIPDELFQEPASVEELPEQPEEDPPAKRIEELKESIARGKAAEDQLEQLFHEKVARLRRQSMEVEGMGSEEGQGTTAAGGLRPGDEPWRITEEDLAGRAELREELERLRFPVDGTFVTELANRLEDVIAVNTSELDALVVERETLGIGPRLPLRGRGPTIFGPPVEGEGGR